MVRKSGSEKTDSAAAAGAAGLLRGLGTLVDLVAKLAEDGQELQRSGELGGGEKGKGFKAVYGLSVRMGAGGKTEAQPFGNVRTAPPGAVVDEVREPMTDVFDEADHVLVVAEMPGVQARDVHFDIRGDILELTARHRDRAYQKEIVLPAAVDAQAATVSLRNGILELSLPKLARGGK